MGKAVEQATVMRLLREKCFQLCSPWWTESPSLAHWNKKKQKDNKGGKRRGKRKANQIAQRSALVLIVLSTGGFCIRPLLLYWVRPFSSYVARKHLGFHYETKVVVKVHLKKRALKKCGKEHSEVESLPGNGQRLPNSLEFFTCALDVILLRQKKLLEPFISL